MRRALAVSSLSIALLAVVASSASAATFSPPSLDFGKQPRLTISPPQTMTLTKATNLKVEFVDISAVYDRSLEAWLTTSDCPYGYLTETAPTCTVTVRFTPNFPGLDGGTVFTTEYPDPSKPTARFTGVATKPCRAKPKPGQRKGAFKKGKCKGFPRYRPSG